MQNLLCWLFRWAGGCGPCIPPPAIFSKDFDKYKFFNNFELLQYTSIIENVQTNCIMSVFRENFRIRAKNLNKIRLQNYSKSIKIAIAVAYAYFRCVLLLYLGHMRNLTIFRSVYVPILTYGHECWILKEKVRSQVQAAQMGFLRKISGLTLLDKVKRADIRESLNIESLLLRLERS